MTDRTNNDRISDMIAAGVSPRDAIAAVDAADAIAAAKVAVAERTHAERVAAELTAERDELNDALRYDRIAQRDYDREFDVINAYATIARETGATIAQVREVAASLARDNERNLSLDERVELGYLTELEADDERDEADGCELHAGDPYWRCPTCNPEVDPADLDDVDMLTAREMRAIENPE